VNRRGSPHPRLLFSSLSLSPLAQTHRHQLPHRGHWRPPACPTGTFPRACTRGGGAGGCTQQRVGPRRAGPRSDPRSTHSRKPRRPPATRCAASTEMFFCQTFQRHLRALRLRGMSRRCGACEGAGRACDVCATARSPQQLQGHDRNGTGARSGSAVLCGPVRLISCETFHLPDTLEVEMCPSFDRTGVLLAQLADWSYLRWLLQHWWYRSPCRFYK
jgi:hypothetical protein